ncbi:MAG TPA: DNA primase [Methylococcales bacterium]|jgi:DNA primase|nr:DNA primase [Methylococcaceae bacterium]HIN69213.1 DNA primase [Methylococcales bacterium]
MVGLIPSVFIDDLLTRVDVVDLIDSYLPLKKTGSNYVARCPFHTEKTPSFSVSRSKQFYHCFGCGASGNAIGFLMDFSHLNFVEAVEDLASFVGIDVPREESATRPLHDKQDLASLYTVQQHVAKFYAQQLRDSSNDDLAVQYFKTRGVSGEVARDFLLGYAPDQWHLLADQFEVGLLKKAGLVIAKENGRVYDRFRGRIMFPIRDRRGRVVAFGARVLGDAVPKYLNSPETPVFQKSNEVYGLYELLEKEGRPAQILLVEGYMDVIALAQFGLRNAVATLGTAPSRMHFDLLFRFTTEIVVCFDGDEAGLKAAWRAVEAALPCLKDGRHIRIMLLPEREDPDSLIRSEGVDAFLARLATASSLSDYFFSCLSEDLDMQTLEGRAALMVKAKAHLEILPPGYFREMMVGKLNEQVEHVAVELKPEGTRRRSNTSKEKVTPARTANALLLQNPELAQSQFLNEGVNLSLDSPGLNLLRKVLAVIAEKPELTTGGLLESFRGEPEESQVRALVQMPVLVPEAVLEMEFAGAVRRLVAQVVEADLAQLLKKEQALGLTLDEKKKMLRFLAMK